MVIDYRSQRINSIGQITIFTKTLVFRWWELGKCSRNIGRMAILRMIFTRIQLDDSGWALLPNL